MCFLRIAIYIYYICNGKRMRMHMHDSFFPFIFNFLIGYSYLKLHILLMFLQ